MTRTRLQRGKVSSPTLVAVALALVLGVCLGLYGAGLFHKKESSEPEQSGTSQSPPETPNEPSKSKPSPAAPESEPEKTAPETPDLSSPNAPTPKKPGPSDPDFVPTEDPEPIETPARDPDRPDLDPEPIKKD